VAPNRCLPAQIRPHALALCGTEGKEIPIPNQFPGPPFAIEPEALRLLAAPNVEVHFLGEATCSHPRRAGREFLLVGAALMQKPGMGGGRYEG